jgi:hypothetical protein
MDWVVWVDLTEIIILHVGLTGVLEKLKTSLERGLTPVDFEAR